MECTRTKSDFEELELLTGSCKHECYCDLLGGCPLRQMIIEDESIAEFMEKGMEMYDLD